MLHNLDSRAASLSFLAIIYHNTQGTRNGARKGACIGIHNKLVDRLGTVDGIERIGVTIVSERDCNTCYWLIRTCDEGVGFCEEHEKLVRNDEEACESYMAKGEK